MRLGLTKYAETRAVLRHCASEGPARVLGALNISDREWLDADRHWRERIEADLASGASALAEEFDAAFQVTREQLQTVSASVDDLRDLQLGFDELDAAPSASASPPASTDAVVTPPANVGYPPEPVSVPRVKVGSVTVGNAGSRDFASVPVLPFAGATATPPSSAVEDFPPVSPGDVNQTEALGMVIDFGDALPFPADDAPSAGPIELTLEQYASLSAELAAYPDRQDDTFCRYGLASPDSRAALEASWSARLRESPEMNERWLGLVRHYREWLANRPS